MISLGKVVVLSPKISINILRTYEKLTVKENQIGSEKSFGTNRHTHTDPVTFT